MKYFITIVFLLLKFYMEILNAHEFPKEDYCYKSAKISFLHDIDEKLNFTSAYNELFNRKLFKSNQLINFGSTRKPVWIYLKVNTNHYYNPSFQKCVFTLDNPLLDEINIYEVLAPSNIVFITQLGDKLPFNDRYYRLRNYVFPYQANQNKEYLFQVKTTSNMTIPTKVQWRDEYFNNVSLDYLYLGFFYGIMFVFVMFGLHNFIAQSNRAYLLHALFALSLMLFFIDRDGIAFQIFWPDANLFKQKTPRIIAVIAMVLGVSYYLSLIRVRSTCLKLASKLYILIASLFGISLIFLNPAYTQIPTILMALGQPILMILLSIYALKRENHFAPYLLLGAIVSLLGLVIHSLGITNIIPANFFTHNAMKFTTLIDFLFLSIAIQKKIQSTIDKSAKYEGISEIATMIIHDIKAPYDKLNTFFSMALKLPLEQVRDYLKLSRDSIISDFDSVVEMISDLKHMGQKQNINENTPTSILDKIDTWPFKAKIEYKGLINIDTVSLKRIIENLMKNALEATINCTNSEYWLNISDLDQKVQITVGNTGSKIMPEDFREVFELFFTKGKENGSGIGLSFVSKKVKHFGGSVYIESNGRCSKRGKVNKKYSDNYVEINVILKKGVLAHALSA